MTSERMLIVMPNWFGETLFATPFLRAVRHAAPHAFLGVLGVPRCQEVLAANPHLDQFVLYDQNGVHRTVGGKWQLSARLRQMRFGLAFILRPSLTRTLMLAVSGIPRRIGFANPKSGWLLTDRVPRLNSPMHKAQTYFRLLHPLGLSETPHAAYEYHVSDAERKQADVLLREVGRAGKLLLILHPGANWDHKRWAPERFAALADRLTADGSCSVVITGGPEDMGLAEAICRRMAHHPAVLVGHTTLRQIAACLERASLVISNDTGVLHLAASLRRPVVALYGPTSPAITGPLGDPERTLVIHHADCCPQIPCFNPNHPSHPGMGSISVEEVYAAAKAMLEGRSWTLEAGKDVTHHA